MSRIGWTRSMGGGTVALVLVLGGSLALELRAEEPEKRVERARGEATQREGRARDYQKEAEALLAELEALDRELVASRRSERAVRRQQQQLERELEETQAASEAARRELSQVDGQMAARLIALYKSRVSRGLPWLYSPDDLQASLRTAAAFQQLLAADRRLFDERRARFEECETREQAVRAKVVELEGTEAEYLRRKQRSAKKLIERRNMVDLLRTRADRELRAARELREAARRLEAQIEKGQTGAQGTGLARRRVPRPVRGTIRQGFGRRVQPEFSTVTQRMGIEFDAVVGTPVRAVGPGRVLFAGWFRGYGQVVIVDHGRGSVSVSGYLEELAVKPDDVVLEGQVIGSVGETGSLSGPGLYFELRKDGQPVDPEAWFQP